MDDNQIGLMTRELTVGIVSSYVANNSVRADDLPTLISSIHAALTGLGEADPAPAAEPIVKPVSVKKSIHSDYLISMEDGQQYQSLKRHLGRRGLTPAQYRTKWGLPDDYPMTASGYSERRSALAKSLGLGRKRSEDTSAEEEIAPARAEVPAAVNSDADRKAGPKAKRGRKKVDR